MLGIERPCIRHYGGAYSVRPLSGTGFLGSWRWDRGVFEFACVGRFLLGSLPSTYLDPDYPELSTQGAIYGDGPRAIWCCAVVARSWLAPGWPWVLYVSRPGDWLPLAYRNRPPVNQFSDASRQIHTRFLAYQFRCVTLRPPGSQTTPTRGSDDAIAL